MPSPSKSPRPKKSSAAPSERISNQDLAPAFDELNSLWRSAEAKLASWNLPNDASVHVSRTTDGPYEPDDSAGSVETVSLVLTKHEGQWRICKRTCRSALVYVGPPDEFGETVVGTEDRPILECTSKDRIDFAPFLKKLVESVQLEGRQTTERLRSALATARAALADLQDEST